MLKPLVSIDWLKKNIRNRRLIILDGSIPDTINQRGSHFPGIQIKNARFFDLKKTFCDNQSPLPNTLPNAEIFERKCRELGINQDSLLVVYDNLGIYSSPRVWWMFRIMGFDNVGVLDGGLPAWMEENLETEPNIPRTYSLGNFRAIYRDTLVSSKEKILSNLNSKFALVLDVRPRERFYGMVPEPRKNVRSGHIPQAINLPFTSVLKGTKFLSLIELRKLLGKLDLQNLPIIVSCGSGITACIILLALELTMDNNKSLYDGSWTEWGQSNDLPISKS